MIRANIFITATETCHFTLKLRKIPRNSLYQKLYDEVF